MRKALIDNEGQVVNVVLLADDVTEWDGYQAVAVDDEPVGPGWSRAGDGWEPPAALEPAPDPDEALRDAIAGATTLAQLKAALLGSGAGAVGRVAGRPV
jgi:hypothetical protein